MIPVIIAMRFERPPGVTIRAWREGMKSAWGVVAMAWHRDMLPDHFKPYAKFKYGHQPRKNQYKRDKEAATRGIGRYRRMMVEAPGTTDLVFTGDMRDLLLYQQPDVRTFPTRARLSYQAPYYLIRRVNKRRSKQPDKRAEIAKITIDQAQKLQALMRAEVLKRFEYAGVQPYQLRIVA